MEILGSGCNVLMVDDFSVLIPDGENVFAILVLRCLSQVPGLRTYILSNNPWAPIRFSRYGTQFSSNTGGKSDEGRLEAIWHTVKQMKADVILPVGQDTIRLLSKHAATLSHFTAVAPVPAVEVFDIAVNKWSLADWLKKNDIPHPPTILFQPKGDFDKRLSDLQFPVLIKPTRGGNGRGIRVFDDPSILLTFFKENLCLEEFIVQSFVRGYDVDCSVLCEEGKILAYTIQKGFIEGYHPFGPPAGIEFLADRATYDVVRLLMDRLHWSGIAHIDLRYDEHDKQVKVIEINPRYWGTLLGSLIAGVNFPYLACLAGLRVEVPNTEYQFKRFVAGTAAFKMLSQRFLKGHKAEFDFDSSSIGFILKDPLPEILMGCVQTYKKVSPKAKKSSYAAGAI
jgi:predicted ATP-grasp superfamily ATP-dependent carboligase